jgi:hypothetical protein
VAEDESNYEVVGGAGDDGIVIQSGSEENFEIKSQEEEVEGEGEEDFNEAMLDPNAYSESESG